MDQTIENKGADNNDGNNDFFHRMVILLQTMSSYAHPHIAYMLVQLIFSS